MENQTPLPQKTQVEETQSKTQVDPLKPIPWTVMTHEERNTPELRRIVQCPRKPRIEDEEEEKVKVSKCPFESVCWKTIDRFFTIVLLVLAIVCTIANLIVVGSRAFSEEGVDYSELIFWILFPLLAAVTVQLISSFIGQLAGSFK
jgi:hypothetical protein